tara:strand:+ start:1407 stop:1652 length:246 start_codon:yes stop_codon:yes gene_type:complete
MVQIHFGYVIFFDGTDKQYICPLVAASLQGLRAQAFNMGLKLKFSDYISSIDDLEEYDNDMMSEMEYALHSAKGSFTKEAV